jgi:hypothetical protein
VTGCLPRVVVLELEVVMAASEYGAQRSYDNRLQLLKAAAIFGEECARLRQLGVAFTATTVTTTTTEPEPSSDDADPETAA